jgi:'Cold-shock' DNA-binding domain
VVVSSPALTGVFVHYSEIDGYGFRSLKENQHVEFEVTQGLEPCRPPTSAPPEPRQAKLAQ